MLGSQAFHAWAEDSLYITADNGHLIFESESKSAESATHRFSFGPDRHAWAPIHTTELLNTPQDLDFTGVADPRVPMRARGIDTTSSPLPALQVLIDLGPGQHSHQDVARHAAQMGLTMTYTQAYRQLKALHGVHKVNRYPDPNRTKERWSIIQ
jgi:hypothetical protein